MSSLAGKIALVTGGGRGIGAASALALAEAGADVVVCSRSANEINSIADRIRAGGRRALALTCDVTDAAQVRQLAGDVARELGAVEILVNNAGLGRSHRFADHPDELWEEMLTLNLTSVYRVTKAFVPAMIERRRGRIINIASTASKVGGKYIAAYTAAKHGVLGLTRALATELVASGITVNAICPGYVNTPMTDENVGAIAAKTGMTGDAVRETLAQLNPQKRLIEADEVAALAVWLARDGAQGVNGQAINVDGGAVMF